MILKKKPKQDIVMKRVIEMDIKNNLLGNRASEKYILRKKERKKDKQIKKGRRKERTRKQGKMKGRKKKGVRNICSKLTLRKRQCNYLIHIGVCNTSLYIIMLK